MKDIFMEAREICKTFNTGGSILGRRRNPIKAVDNISLSICKGETLGLVGESGCGKSTLGKCLLRAVEPDSGTILVAGGECGTLDFTQMSPKNIKTIRTRMQMIFQDPFNSLNPNMTVRDLIAEPLVLNLRYKQDELDQVVGGLMADVGLDRRYMGRYPHAFSGGQRQRICIARAISTGPDFIVCDEAVSALDVSVRAQIINLLMELQEKRKMAYLFISHDLSVVWHISSRVAVMYAGKIVETGNTEEVFMHTAHPYTQLLLDSAPSMEPKSRKLPKDILPDASVNTPDAESALEGCAFLPRCTRCGNEKKCRQAAPEFKKLGNTHQAACWLV